MLTLHMVLCNYVIRSILAEICLGSQYLFLQKGHRLIDLPPFLHVQGVGLRQFLLHQPELREGKGFLGLNLCLHHPTYLVPKDTEDHTDQDL